MAVGSYGSFMIILVLKINTQTGKMKFSKILSCNFQYKLLIILISDSGAIEINLQIVKKKDQTDKIKFFYTRII